MKQSRTGVFLWVLVLAYLALTAGEAFFPGFCSDLCSQLVFYVLLVFALAHAVRSYGLRTALLFLASCLAISSVLENLSILTSFPFGWYHYRDGLGLMILDFPLAIALMYFAVGYLAWVLAGVLLGRAGRLYTVCWQPVIGAFMMVGWDLTMDPANSTIDGLWVWRDGGAYFGVPFSNFLGWFLTVWLIFLSFALISCRRKQAEAAAGFGALQAAALYGAVGLVPVWTVLARPENKSVTDQAGTAWSTGDIYQSLALVSLFTMVFVAVLSAARLNRRPTREV